MGGEATVIGQLDPGNDAGAGPGRVAAAGAPGQLCRGARGMQKEVSGLGVVRLGRKVVRQ